MRQNIRPGCDMENYWIVSVWSLGKEIFGIVGLIWLIRVFYKAFSDLRKFAEWRIRMEPLLSAARGDPRPPFLVLRSFFERNTQSLFHLDNSVGALLLYLWQSEEQPSVDFVSQLSRATTKYGPLLAIGGREIEQAGLSKHRIVVFVDSSELDWQFLFLETAKASRAIFVLPARTKAIIIEVSLLARSGLTGKTIVLMPGAYYRGKFSEQALSILEDKWAHIQVQWMLKGLHLPSYVAKGMLYIPNSDFSIRHSSLLGPAPHAFEVSLASILAKLDGTCRSTRDLLLEIDR
ncbi:MAG: hypothetical protein LAP86_31655 [Acidobacteriia bacterium]|nr:hypothetical protein [Terriglobia bacterium]